jgi:DNA-binding NarL/FixJ family response regulator
MHEEVGYFRRMTEAGAKGFLLKKTNQDQLEEAINAVFRGDYYFAEEYAFSMKHASLSARKINIVLSDREKEILEYICRGYSNWEIAKKLGISQRTIDGHRARLFEKTGAKNAPNLVLFAIKNGLVSI